MWSPFRKTGHHCVWSGGIAIVWLWDNDKVQVVPDLLDIPAGADAVARLRPPSGRVEVSG